MAYAIPTPPSTAHAAYPDQWVTRQLPASGPAHSMADPPLVLSVKHGASAHEVTVEPSSTLAQLQTEVERVTGVFVRNQKVRLGVHRSATAGCAQGKPEPAAQNLHGSLPGCHLQLIFKGKVLDASKPLAAQGLKSGASVMLLASNTGATATQVSTS